MEEQIQSGNMMEISLTAVIVVLCIIIIVVFLKMQKQKKALKESQNKSKEIDQKQDAMLESMTEDIYHLTQNLVESHDTELNPIESAILNSANNLRELLKIKSNKVEIFYENFSFSHMLDDITANMVPHFKDQETELVFQVDDNVPLSMTTDVVHLSRIINNIFEFSILATPKGIVKMKAWTSGKDKSILNIEITDSSEGLDNDALHDIFNLGHNDETGEHVGLALYIAKELSAQMGGRLEAKSKKGHGNTFFVAVPIEPSSTEELKLDKVFLKSIARKKVLIYSPKPATAASLKILLHTYYQYITIIEQKDIEKSKVNFAEFDLLILDEVYFDVQNAAYLDLIKQNKALRIVSTSSIFSSGKEISYDCIDTHVSMPLTREKTKELIAYIEDQKEEVETLTSSYIGALAVYKAPIQETAYIKQSDFKHFSGSRLLIVEDNLINQKILLGVLKDSGIDIDIANNGQEALDLLFIEKKPYDLILMDISMPVMDGEEASKKIRESASFDDLPIVTFTAFAMGEEIERMFLVGVNAYLTKPLNIKKLYTIFSVFLGNINREIVLKGQEKIDGLDIKSGITWADESETLYKETLKEFVQVYAETAESMPKLIEEKRYEQIKIICREIQGILTFIGAYEMKEVVDEVQKQLIYNNDGLMEECKEKYPKVLNKLIKNIKEYV